MPPEPGLFRLEMRAEPAAFGTVVDLAWTFRSGHVPGGDWRRMPLRAVSFAPVLRADGTAAAGRAFRFPYRMTTQATTAVRPGVEVSYDDGRSWFPALVTATHVAVAHPGGKGWVSLRATAEGLEQTTLRAYPFGPCPGRWRCREDPGSAGPGHATCASAASRASSIASMPCSSSSSVTTSGGTTCSRLKCVNGHTPRALQAATTSAIGLAAAPDAL